MKKIEAYIRPERFEFVKTALEVKKFYGMSVTDVKGRGHQKGITIQYRGGSIDVDFIPKCKIEIIVRDGDEKLVVETIIEAARTGKVGDGRIFISTIDRAIRVRTGEEDPSD
jgi:nitrogen regulatory protein P-II 1